MPLSPIDYDVDGVKLTGWMVSGAAGRRAPGVLVAHEATGVNDHVKARAQSLADLGYVAFVLDLYGETGFPLSDVMAKHTALLSQPGRIFRRAKAALDVLAAHPDVDPARLAAIGFCQGGVTSLELARGGADILCAVGFHPALVRPAGSPDGPIRAKVLMMVGDADPLVPPEHRQAFAAQMDAAGADWQLHVFGGVSHGYTDTWSDSMGAPGFAYSETAAKRAWKMMLDLLKECF